MREHLSILITSQPWERSIVDLSADKQVDDAASCVPVYPGYTTSLREAAFCLFSLHWSES